MIRTFLASLLAFCFITSCQVQSPVLQADQSQEIPFDWKHSTVYFLLTDRFNNVDKSNDFPLERKKDAALLRGYEGGDFKGIIQKLDEGYFKELGVSALWLTPIVEQIAGSVDEGTGKTYGFHGYWTKDWTAIDPNLGTKAEFKSLVEKAHQQGIRIVLDAVINHTGPVTEIDPKYPSNWVRTSPQCTYEGYGTTVPCTLVANLPDILTESSSEVALPEMLVEKWKKEGRYEEEVQELDAFFQKTGYPRAPKYYIIKWLSDYILDYGIDGYRLDTVKHTEPDVWKDFANVTQESFQQYKVDHPSDLQKGVEFFLVGEVYGYGISQHLNYDFGDRKVNYFNEGIPALINFDFKGDANKSYEELFSYYNEKLSGPMGSNTVMNYLSSHDDGSPFDKERKRTFEAATKLLLSPGIAQIYYGDETARALIVPGAEGDANLRSVMNWSDLEKDASTKALFQHYSKLGRFRQAHPAIGEGEHKMISSSPYYFSRVKGDDKVIVGLDLPKGEKSVEVAAHFSEGSLLHDFYSGTEVIVQGGKAKFSTPYEIVLLEKIK